MTALEDRLAPAANLNLVAPGILAGPFDALQGKVNAGVFTAPTPLPLIGNGLATPAASGQAAADRPGQFLGDIQQKLAGFAPTPAGAALNATDIKRELAAKLGGYVAGGEGGITTLTSGDGSDVRFQMTLQGTKFYDDALNFVPADAANPNSRVKIPGVVQANGVKDTEKQVDATVTWTFHVTLGVSEARGFFLDLARPDDITVDVQAALNSGFAASGRMGLLPAAFTQDPANPSTFSGSYSVNLTDADADTLLTTAENAGAFAGGTVTGAAAVRLKAEGSFLPPGTPVPSGVFDLKFDSDLTVTQSFAAADPRQVGTAGLQTEYGDVELDVEGFFRDFVEPIVGRVQGYLRPLEPVFKLLYEPIPVIGPLLTGLNGSGTVATLADLIPAFTPAAQRPAVQASLDAAKLLYGFYKLDLPTPSALAGQAVKLGKFVASAAGPVTQAEAPAQTPADQLAAQTEDNGKAKHVVKDILPTFRMPILNDPASLLPALLGSTNPTEQADLFGGEHRGQPEPLVREVSSRSSTGWG